MANEDYTLTLKAPLLRPGITLTVGPMSRKYATQATLAALNMVREINDSTTEKIVFHSTSCGL